MALRAPQGAQRASGGAAVAADVHGTLARMHAFTQAVHGGAIRGATGERFTHVLNIGIGGSDLGPVMAVRALVNPASPMTALHLGNVDGHGWRALLAQIDPRRTLVLVASKTFTTQETMANAGVAREWLVAALGEKAIPRHFAAVSTNRAAVEAFGIAPENTFGFWDWVGGRYSLWSAVGLSLMVALGPENFRALLAGARAMDEHFRHAPFEGNLPVLMALCCFWNTSFLGAADHVVAPYDQRLEKFVAWLQQLEMESNGKGVNRAGEPLPYASTPALWGDVGTNAQHAFFQMLHQGSETHPVDILLVREPDHPHAELHELLLANGIAQSRALMRGKTAEEVRAELLARGLVGEALEAAIPHRVFPGNRPSNTLLLPRLDAKHLGALCALYEHRCFVLSVLWDVNPFDQWGVELGKQLAGEVLKGLQGEAVSTDSSTRALLHRLRG
jgi:glucose-6-phosphate isomerase